MKGILPLNVPIVDKDDDTKNVAQMPPNNVSNSGEQIAPDTPAEIQLTEKVRQRPHRAIQKPARLGV